jgi:hypothetical protein
VCLEADRRLSCCGYDGVDRSSCPSVVLNPCRLACRQSDVVAVEAECSPQTAHRTSSETAGLLRN